jgi:Carboxypeptidase regulatory-like domain/TonB dependent receptor-like, beta-barrel
MIGFKPRSLQMLLVSVLLALLLSGHPFAQQNPGSIKGTITDQLGGLVVEATIVATDSRGTARTATTNANGGYEFRSLAPGKYDLRITAIGFNTLEEKNVQVNSGKNTNLDLQLSIGIVEQTVTVDNKGVSTDSDRNADATVLRQRELEALPDDPDALIATLKAMAGPTQDENGAQVKVDGFSNGQVPPKEAIREVRINQNPFSAENEYPGWGGIEIFTQPGSEKFHGGVGAFFNDESLNSRNPFAPRRAPYQQRALNLNLTGPIKKKRASFATYFNRYASDNNAIINATTLDLQTLKPVPVNETIVTPSVSTNFSLRGDLKLNKRHTLVSSYSFNEYSQDPAGIGGFSLRLRGYRSTSIYHTFQATETAVINEKTINETRLQISHGISRQTASTALPALNVQESFFGGGAQVGNASNTQDRGELQNFTSWQTGNHFIKVGGRLRYVRTRSIAPSNFDGTYTFSGGVGPVLDAQDHLIPGAGPIELSSLERYRRTLLFERMGLTGTQIRILGGGATQFSVAGGNPEAEVKQSDIGFYIQDEWKLRPHLTISPGLRYENQTNIESNLNFAPRLAFAWSPIFGSPKKTAAPSDNKDGAQAKTPPKPAPPREPKTVFRGGIGVFYNRVSEDLILQALRFDGLNQRQYVVTDPTVLDLFPVVPPINLLDAFAQPQTRRFLSSDLGTLYSLRTSLSVDQQLSKTFKLNVSYSHGQTLRAMRTVNINAPLGGTYNPVFPTSGVRPLGQSEGNILESQSNGRYRFDNLNVSLNGRLFKIDFWGNYVFGKSLGTDNGTSGSPFDAYDFSNEWGRASYDTRHRFFGGANYSTKSGWNLSTFMVASTGSPFNITTGHDTNGDTFFTERPAFAKDLNKAGVIVTPYGALDPNPTAGETIIPRNLGQGPAFFTVTLSASKSIKFGRAIPPKGPPPGANATVSSTVVAAGASGNAKPPAKPPVQRPYQLVFGVYANNLFNRNNLSLPVGNMASPYFLKSTSSGSGGFSFGPGGSGSNRQFMLRARLSF